MGAWKRHCQNLSIIFSFHFGHLPVPLVNAFSTGQSQDGPDPAHSGGNGPFRHPV